MKVNLATTSTMISDTDAPDVPEQPVIVEDYEGSGGLSLIGWDGETVFMSYRMVKEVCKQMIEYAKPKKKK